MQKNREITTFPKKKKDLGKMQSDEKTVFPDYEKKSNIFCRWPYPIWYLPSFSLVL